MREHETYSKLTGLLEDRGTLPVDPALLEQPEICFNAARLDRSPALVTEDRVAIAEPRVEPIAG
ncbi:hypothetical protein [Streptomyces sp. NPDC048196]|uniref:hypothetical protein n=1 Tax=Streptomyces sp. NPDC048196 TaxID=3154712 RepID=UPI0033C624FD